MTFRPLIGLDGFRVVSSFDVETFTCNKLESQTFQLGILLFPPELVNEKFLINARNCMLKLNEKHPVKKWLKAQSSPLKPDPREQENSEFLNEILNTPFNLLTDQKVKAKVIALLADVPEGSNLEKLLKSYLYLMIGNLTRSDRLLKEIISQTPREFYKGYTVRGSLYHRMTLVHLEKVIRKFGRHPSDRLTFYLFTLYLKSFTNKIELLELAEDVEPDKGDKLGLAYTERIAAPFVAHARLARMSEKRRMKNLRMDKYPAKMQAQWVWPFLEVDPLVSELMASEVRTLDTTDPLWAIYLLDNEKLADFYFRKGGVPVSRRRSLLRKHLADKEDFMLTTYKLIEIGDVNDELVQSVSLFFQNAR